jgi:hypothetical protein
VGLQSANRYETPRDGRKVNQHMDASGTKTDDSKLVTTDTVYVSPDGGTTDEAFPKPNVQ